MNPPDWLAARVTCSVPGHVHQVGGGNLVQTISAPRSGEISLGRPAGRHREGDPGPRDRTRRPGSTDEERLVVGERAPLVVDEGHVLAPGVEDRAEVGPRGPHQLGDPGGASLRSKPSMPGGVGVGVDHQDLGAQLGQQVGHDEAGRPERVVEHQLEPGGRGPTTGRWSRPGPPCSARGCAAGSRCRRSRGPALGGSPRGGTGARSSAGSSRRRRSRPCRRSAARPTGDRRGPGGPTRPGTGGRGDLEAGDRHGRRLEVVDVHAGRVVADHDGPLQHPGRPAGVARAGDGRPLVAASRPSHGQAHGQFGTDVHVGETADTVPSEQRPGAPRSQTIDELTAAPASTVLNG